MNIDLSKAQRYLEWLKTKIYLDYKACNAPQKYIRKVYRGQVYFCHFGVGVGSEQEKINRPCVILQNHAANLHSPNTIVAPITHSSSTLDVVVPIATQYNPDGTILLDGNVLLGNIVTVSKARLGDFITTLPVNEMKDVDKALSLSVSLYTYYKDVSDSLADKISYITKIKTERNEAQDNLKSLYTVLGVANIEDAMKKIQELQGGNL